MNYKSLRDKVAVVTGASSGIGAAVVRALDREGAHVALAARRESALLEVQAGLEGRGGGVQSMVAATDVADRDQVRSLVARTEEELGPVDVLVNCAGMMYYTLVYYTKYTTLHSEISCPTGRREARGALGAGCSG
jgi:NAD(P)-dependent dehydrogenase (short-subunit alcohol dehydrogenase family)